MPDDLRRRITAQFSYRGDRADVWRAFDRVLDTDAYLNLGYSERYRPHLLGSSQRRLALELGGRLADALPATDGVRLLDVGCGRGGPACALAERFGFRVVGVDLVPYNVRRATEAAASRAVDAAFVVGDATDLPVASGSVGACTAVDSIVYVPEKRAAFAELARVLEPGGVAVWSDLVMRSGVADADRRIVDAFADAWDMPPLSTLDASERAAGEAGLAVRSVEDVTPHSVGRFRRWTALYLGLAARLRRPLDYALRRFGLDPTAVTEQVRRAHDALPHLRHVVVVAERPDAPSDARTARDRTNTSATR